MEFLIVLRSKFDFLYDEYFKCEMSSWIKYSDLLSLPTKCTFFSATLDR